MKLSDDHMGAAVLGMYAAIKICRREGVDPKELCDVVWRDVFIKCKHVEVRDGKCVQCDKPLTGGR